MSQVRDWWRGDLNALRCPCGTCVPRREEIDRLRHRFGLGPHAGPQPLPPRRVPAVPRPTDDREEKR